MGFGAFLEGVKWVLGIEAARSLVLLIALAGTEPGAFSAELDGAAVSRSVREAVGYAHLKSRAYGLVAEGDVEVFGETGKFSLRFDPAGRFVRRVNWRLDTASGFDGEQGWAVDWTGMPRILELDSLSVVQTPIWVMTGRWLADDSPFTVSVNPRFSNEKQVALDLHLEDSTLAIIMGVDRKTWLPISVCTGSSNGQDEWSFEDYRSCDGFMLPHRITHTSSGSSKPERTEIRSVTPGTASAENPYAPVTARPDDTRFDPNLPAEVKIKRTAAGPLLFRPRVNGQDVGWFVLDSGAAIGMVISPDAANTLDMPAYGEVTARGVGPTPAASRFREGKSFDLGRMSISRPVFLEVDMSFLQRYVAEPVAGLCGYDLLARAVVELDVQEERMALLDPATYALPEGEWQELFLEFKFPCVRARFEGPHEGLFRIDTGPGLALSVIFHKPAVARYSLLEGRETTFAGIQGVGGISPTRQGKLEWFELGGHRFDEPTVMFEIPQRVAVDSGYHLFGMLGLQFFKPFRAVFNYPERKIAFVERGTSRETPPDHAEKRRKPGEASQAEPRK